jgi:hypothetical protein
MRSLAPDKCYHSRDRETVASITGMGDASGRNLNVDLDSDEALDAQEQEAGFQANHLQLTALSGVRPMSMSTSR